MPCRGITVGPDVVHSYWLTLFDNTSGSPPELWDEGIGDSYTQSRDNDASQLDGRLLPQSRYIDGGGPTAFMLLLFLHAPAPEEVAG
jgi:hypothetical protein